MFVNLSQPQPYNQRWHVVDHLLFTWRNVHCAGIIVVIISARMRDSRAPHFKHIYDLMSFYSEILIVSNSHSIHIYESFYESMIHI